jgi:hypothetical protein
MPLRGNSGDGTVTMGSTASNDPRERHGLHRKRRETTTAVPQSDHGAFTDAFW